MSMRIWMPFVLLALFPSGASAQCNYEAMCVHVRFCLQDLTPRNDADRQRLIAGLSSGNAAEIYDATHACQKNIGTADLDVDSAGCFHADYLAFAATAQADQCPGRPPGPVIMPPPYGGIKCPYDDPKLCPAK